MAESSEKKWYVLHTYSGYENKVKSNLESRAESMGMEDYIFRVVVPEEEKCETTKTGKEKVEKLKDVPWIRAGRNGHDRPIMVCRSKHARRYRICRLAWCRKQTGASS